MTFVWMKGPESRMLRSTWLSAAKLTTASTESAAITELTNSASQMSPRSNR